MKMWPGEEVVVLVFMLSFWSSCCVSSIGAAAREGYCPGRGEASATKPTHPFATVFDITCAGHFSELHCCVPSFHTITWYFNDTPIVDAGPRQLNTDNQSLTLLKTTRDDSGSYVCIARDSNGLAIYKNNATLQVTDCSKAWVGDPIPTLPPESSPVVFAQLGDTVYLRGRGYFGDFADFTNRVRAIFWTREKIEEDGNKTTTVYLVGRPNKDPRFTVLDRTLPESDMMEMELRITDLRMSDLGRYYCIYFNPHGRLNRSIILERGDEKQEVVVNKPASYGLVGLSALVLVLILVLILVVFFRREIRLFIKDSFWQSPPAGRLYEAFVFYNDESAPDRAFVGEVLRPKLEGNLGYHLGLKSRDFVPGLAKVQNYENARIQSGIFLFIVSPALVSHEWSEFALHHAIANNHQVAFLLFEDVPETLWTESTRPMKEAMTYDGRTVRFPGGDAPKRATEKFWQELRLLLPQRVTKGGAQGTDTVEMVPTKV